MGRMFLIAALGLLAGLRAPAAQERGVEWVGLRLVWISPGTFEMGSPTSEIGHLPAEGPVTRVTLTRGYWLGDCAVTQGQWTKVMGTTVVDQARAAQQDDTPVLMGGKRSMPVRDFFGMKKTDDVMRLVGNVDPDVPMIWVSWNEAVDFCRRLTAAEARAKRLPEGYVYRLPTEAEWEYAARAGSTGATYNGPLLTAANVDSPALDPIAWYSGNSAQGYTGHAIDTASWPNQKEGLAGEAGPRKVRTRLPNAWGLYDMLGNVAQWCWDWAGTYPGGDVVDWAGPPSGRLHPRRGGGWSSFAPHTRCAFRQSHEPDYRFINLGFRVALAPALGVTGR